MDGKWLEYDWQHEGEDVVCGVDRTHALDDTKRINYTLLLILNCPAKKAAITDSQWRGLEAVKNKLMKKFDLAYAGFIKMSSTVKYYFYAPGQSVAAGVEAAVAKRGGIVCDTVDDPRWRYYFKLLYPTVEKLQTEENFKTIETYRKMGDLTAAPRRITLHMFFPSESLRMLFEEHARLSGFAIGASEFSVEYELPHGVGIYKISGLLKRDVDAITTDAIRIANKYDGILMYWDAPVIPASRMKR